MALARRSVRRLAQLSAACGSRYGMMQALPAVSRGISTSSPAALPDLLLDRLPHASSVKEVHHLTAYGLALGIPLAVVTSSPLSTVLDLSMGFIVPLHAHIGMRSVLVDYMPHMGVQDESMQKAILMGLGAFTVVSAAALLKFNITDVGLSGFVRRFWMRNKAVADGEAH